jgi:hypothetical protein
MASKVAKDIGIGLAVSAIGFAIVEGAKVLFTAKSLEINPGRPSVSVPKMRIDSNDTRKRETILPLVAPVLITNTTGNSITFNHPKAKIYYNNTLVGESHDDTNKTHTIPPHAKDYRLDMHFELPIKSLAGSVADAANYFIKKFTKKDPGQGKTITADVTIKAYGFTVNQKIPYQL